MIQKKTFRFIDLKQKLNISLYYFGKQMLIFSDSTIAITTFINYLKRCTIHLILTQGLQTKFSVSLSFFHI